MLLIIRALINMEIKVAYIVIHVDDMFWHRGKNIDVPWAGEWGNSIPVIMTTYYAGGRLWLPGGVL